MKYLTTFLLAFATLLCFGQKKDLFEHYPVTDLNFKMSSYQRAGGISAKRSAKKKILVLNDKEIINCDFKKAGLNPFNYKGSLMIASSDEDFQRKSFEQILIGMKSGPLPEHFYLNCFYIDKTPFVFTKTEIDKKSSKFYLNIFNPNDKTLTQTEELFEGIVPGKKDKEFWNQWGKIRKRDDGFGYVRSENDEFFAVYTFQEETMVFKTFDKTGKLKYTSDFNYSDIDKNNVIDFQLVLSDTGDLIVLFVQNNNLIIKRSGTVNFGRELIPGIDGYLKSARMTLRQNELFISGCYLTNGSGSDYLEVLSGSLSVYSMKLNAGTGIELSPTAFRVISKEVIKENASILGDQVAQEKAKGNTSYMRKFELSKVFVTEKNEIYIFLEYLDYYVTTYYTQQGAVSSPNYIGSNVITVKFDSGNKYEWTNTLDKYSNNSTPYYRSFALIYSPQTEVLHLVFIDHAKRYKECRGIYKDVRTRFLNKVITDYSITSKGEGKRKAVMKMIDGRDKYKLKRFYFGIQLAQNFDDDMSKLAIPMLGKKMGYFIIGTD